MVLKNPTFEVNFIVATMDPYTDSSSSVATTSAQKKPDNVADDVFEDMEAENWENNDLSSKESSFVELMKKAKNDTEKENLDIVPKSPESPRTKKAKTVFGRCYDPTFHETILGEVLAANSDSE